MIFFFFNQRFTHSFPVSRRKYCDGGGTDDSRQESKDENSLTGEFGDQIIIIFHAVCPFPWVLALY